jgi:3-oxoadipate enol-lactonase
MTRIETGAHDGLSFCCRLDGPAGAPWLVMSNSITTDGRIWDAQVPVLAGRFRILRYDQRGHGGTTVPPGPCDFAQLGGDVLALLNHFGIERCTFVGLSMGVPTGLQAFSRAPERFVRLVLVDGQAASSTASAAGWEARIAQVRAAGMEALADATLARWFAPDFVAAGKAAAARAIIAATPAEGFVACARALQAYDFAEVLPRIRVPVRMIAGANDGAIRDNMAALRGRIADAALVTLPAAGHLPNVEQPAAFNTALVEALAAG